PRARSRRLSRARFLAFRSILVPSCRLSFDQVVERAERVNAGLAGLAAARGVRFFHLNPDWYGFDPIHIRAASWRPAWQEMLGSRVAADGNRGSTIEALRLYLMPPERQWLCGVERLSPQSGKAFTSGSA